MILKIGYVTARRRFWTSAKKYEMGVSYEAAPSTQVDEVDPTLPLGRRLRLEDAFLLQKCPLNQDLSQFMHIIHP